MAIADKNDPEVNDAFETPELQEAAENFDPMRDEANPDNGAIESDELAAGLNADAGEPATGGDPVESVPATDEGAEAITREDGATWDGGKGQWREAGTGKFVQGDPPEGWVKPVAAATPAAGAPAAGAPAPAAAAAKPKEEPIVWEPLTVKADRMSVAVPEARLTRIGGNVMIAVPEAAFAGFQARIAKGQAFENRWQQLDQGIRDLDRQKKELAETPPKKSDAEVEADILLAEIKPQLARLFDEDQLEKLNLRVQLAQRDEKDKYAKILEDRKTESTREEEAQQFQRQNLAETALEIVERYPTEFQGLDDNDIRDVLKGDLLPVIRAIVFREGNEWFINSQYIFDRLKMKAAGKATAAAAKPAQPAASPAAGTPGAPAAKPAAPDKADRFNDGQKTAAKPGTTNVKANRGQPGARPSAPAPTREKVPATAGLTPEQIAEDEWERERKGFMKSGTLDF